MERFEFISKLKINDLPKASGVYAFKNNLEVIYIGKAINIRDRVKNHFQQPSYRDDLFINNVNEIGFFQTDSEIEALVLEANLIKKYQPKYNVVWRDDKNYFYVAFEPNIKNLPHIYITHQIVKNSKIKYIGPFVDGAALKKTLRFLRRAFPYYTVKNHGKNKCTYCHLDLCPGSEPDEKNYKKNIKKLILILQGKKSDALKSLQKEMKELSKKQNFEEAGKIRDKMYALQQIMAHTHVLNGNNINPQNFSPETLQKIIGSENIINKIECYDISNIQGKMATGSMVVFINGAPDKNLYRKFKIKMKNEPNDIAMLKEVFSRRLTHTEWEYPQVMLIDGGIAQLNAAISIKNQINKTRDIKVISIAKGKQELWIEGRKNPIPLKNLPQEVYNLIKHLDDEAHRFAITYHRKLRKKNLLK